MVIDIGDTYRICFHAKSQAYFANKLMRTHLEYLLIFVLIVGADRMQAERHISSSKLDYDLPTGLMVITSPASCITPATAMSLHLKLAGFQINNKLGVGGGRGHKTKGGG